MFAIVGHSEEIDSDSAAKEIIEQCEDKLNGRIPKGGIIFSAIDFEYDVIIENILSHWNDLELIGGTTDGELSSTLGCTEDTIVLMLFGGDEIDVSAGIGHNLSNDVEASCNAAIEMAIGKTSRKPQFCLTIPESLTTSGQKIIETLTAKLGDTIPLLGASAGDQWKFSKTKQFFGHEILSDSIPVLLFSGDIVFSFGIATGWQPIGEPGIVTSSDGSIVHTIDNKPTIQFFEKYLGPGVKPAGENPLIILNEKGETEYLRATFGKSDEEGSIIFFADITQGSKVQNTTVDRDAIIQGCNDSINAALNNYPNGKVPEAAVIFSCSARKLLLGTKVSEEYEQLRGKLGKEIEFCGFYGYGEICPNAMNKPSRFHNESFITLLMGT